MAQTKVLTGFMQYRDVDLLSKANFIIESLTGNPAYPDPAPTMPALQGYVTNYSNALDALAQCTPEKTILKNNARIALEAQLNRLALYVQAAGDNNRALLLTSGYSMGKEPAPIGVLPKPTDLRLAAGQNHGSIKASVKPVPNADSYLFELTETPLTIANDWMGIPSTKSSVEISGLTQGKQYVFRVCAIGSNPMRVYSEEGFAYVA